MDKKREEEILKMIYSSEGYIVLKSEEPDFVMTDKITEYVFGVEITEVFYTESEARLLNIPNYFENIIRKGQYCHKDDVKRLHVERVKIHSAGMETSTQDTKCIIRDIPTRNEIASIIGNAIMKKNEKVSNYRRKIDDNCLIIFDNEHFIRDKGELLANAFNIELIMSIVGSGFKKIYLITRIKGEMVYYELKSASFIFLAFLTLSFTKLFDIDNPDKYYLTLNMLSSLGFKIKTFFSNEEDCIKIKCWDSVVCLAEINEELIIDRIFTDQNTQSGDFQDFTYRESMPEDVKELYFKFLLSKDVLVDLSHKV